MCRECGLTPSIMYDIKSGRKSGLNTNSATKMAQYFQITVEELLGTENAHMSDEERAKIALFSGGVDVTDEMWEKVKEFAKFVEVQYGSKDD